MSEHTHDGQPMTWCTIHQHLHIAEIPDTTYRCSECGWGGWTRDQFEDHRDVLRDPVMYALHQMIEEKHDHVRVVELQFYLPGGQVVSSLATEESWRVITLTQDKSLDEVNWNFPPGYQERVWFGSDILRKAVLKMVRLSGVKED